MASFSFDGVDLKTLGVYLLADTEQQALPPVRQRLVAIPGRHGAYDFAAQYEAREFRLECFISAPSHAQLMDRLASVARLLDVTRGPRALILDTIPDRYWLARVSDVIQVAAGALNAEFTVSLVCAEPFAFSLTETVSTHTIDADPKTVLENPGGSAPVAPVYELTPNIPISGTIRLGNITSNQEVLWMGVLAAGDRLTIDAERYLVKKNDLDSMASVSGSFPRLNPDVDNELRVMGMTGTLKVTYRARYL